MGRRMGLWLVVLCLGLITSPISTAQAATTWKVCQEGWCDYTSIQSAIDAPSTVNGDTVLVSGGTYVENINFMGKAITVQSVNGAASTIIDGNASGSVVTFSSGENENSLLDGFTITNGSGSDDGGGSTDGGGIYCYNYSSPTITNCTINGNSVTGLDGNGGGIFSWFYSSPTITNCIISSNSANDDGGGISCGDSSATITNCIISGNTALSEGGGIRFHNSPLTITNCTISNNSAYDDGGGIACRYSSPTITNCTISGNTVSSGPGGGIWCKQSLPTITNCTISNNSAALEGGGIYCYSSSPTVVNSILWGDTAGGNPNEVHLHDTDSSITISYSNINLSYITGPGLRLIGPCKIGEPCLIDADPLFVGGGDYHLTAGSPCIDAGTPDGAPADDIDGDTRPWGAGYDMGSDEYVAQVPQGIISGFVTDSSYAPIVGARVKLFRGNTLVGSTRTGPNGHYEFVNLLDGKYRVKAKKRGYRRNSKIGKVQQTRPWGKEEFINFILILLCQLNGAK